MALSVSIENEKDSFVVDAIITSDNLDLESKLNTDAFRIDVADRLYALANGNIIKERLEEAENPDLSPSEREQINEEIAGYETRIGTPIITIDKNNYSMYLNTDDESLLENGVQLILESANVLRIRFAPIQNFPFLGDTIDLSVLLCVVGFDFDEFEVTNRKAFDVCLLPKLVTGNIEKEDPSIPDPILPPDTERPDYPFNSKEDIDNLYVNNGENTICTKTPLEIVKTSAYTSDYLNSIIGNDFLWNTSESILLDDTSKTSINLDFTVNGEGVIENIEPPESITARIINDDSIVSENNTLTGIRMYEIIQKIETTGNEAYLKDKVKFAVDI